MLETGFRNGVKNEYTEENTAYLVRICSSH